MDQRIIYKTDTGIAVIVPAPDSGLTTEEVARKDVPTGLPYKIVDVSEIPDDRTFRDAWDIDEAELSDGAGD